ETDGQGQGQGQGGGPSRERMTLAGELAGESGEAAARAVASKLLQGSGDARLDLRELKFADERVARVLARAAAALAAQGRTLRVRATSAGTVRFLERH